MRIAILSDTHFGDDNSQLVSMQNGTPVLGPKFVDFNCALGSGIDYLIMAGDIMDFSIASYEKAYTCARTFFQQVRDDGLVKEIIYIAGNHDVDIWHIIQHQRSVIHKITHGLSPTTYHHSVPGILDDRQSSSGISIGLTLNRVTVNTEANRPKYGGLFLDQITEPITPFNFVYPNLYILTDTETVLVTHGQYLEPYWSILGEVVSKIATDVFKKGDMDVERMMEMNYPLNQLACMGVGQAGSLTEKVIRPVELDIKAKNLDRIKKYLDKLEKEIDKLTDFNFITEFIADKAVRKAKNEAFSALKNMKMARYRQDFIKDGNVRKRFFRYFHATLLEIQYINSLPPFDSEKTKLSVPTRMIFGHTHQPIPWNDPQSTVIKRKDLDIPKGLVIHNTGGWINEGSSYMGAEIFKYETGAGFSSVSVR
jgi:UDP-2,3-diacylglucosamine pyrophosphatase LpxH